VSTYVGRCDASSNPCSNIEPAKVQWVKIDQKGRLPNSFIWYQSQLWANPLEVTLPSNMPPGIFVLRQEIIVLGNPDGAEIFANCINLDVGGSARGYPQAGEIGYIPGSYSNHHPGISVQNIWDWTQPYDFPGTKPSKFDGTHEPLPSTNNNNAAR